MLKRDFSLPSPRTAFSVIMDFKKLLPHVYAALILLAVAAIFFSPNFFGDKVLPQPDNDKARAIQTEIQDYIKKEGKAPLWTNSLFGGMPSYQIYTTPQGNLTRPLAKAAFLFADYTDVWASVFAAMFFMYLLLSVLNCHWLVGVFGALAFGITSYNVDILEAGHSTKMAALAIAPALMAAMVLLFRGRWIAGTGLLALFTAIEIYVNHLQITYYTFILMGIYGLALLVDAILNKQIARWGKAAALSVAAVALGVACNMSKVWPTYEYSQETIRGGSELTTKSEKGNGLDKDYLFGWSYGICESATLVVPHAAGGGSGESYQQTEFFKTIMSRRPDNLTPEQLDRQIGGLLYAGEQPFVGTAIYFGVVAVFLFFLGAFLAQGPSRWWFLLGGLFMVSIAWGKHFVLNETLWYDYLPMFNKFRAVTMAFGPAQLCVAALAALGLQRFLSAEVAVRKKQIALYASLGITAALCVAALACAPEEGPNEVALGDNETLRNLIRQDRSALLMSDLYRSLAFLLAAGAFAWLYLKGKLNATLAVAAIIAIGLTDHWKVCRRTLSDVKYEARKASLAPPAETQFDKIIKADPEMYYRVFDFRGGNMATNFQPSFHHKNIGGYHAAKLQRFQEVVDTFFNGESLPKSLPVLGMLNVKYIITQSGPNRVAEACGNAWFVKNYEVVPDGDTELASLRSINPKETAVVQQKYTDLLGGLTIQPDTTATIRLVKYHPEKLEYEYSAQTDQLAVFSEMYYPPSKGWNVYLNGQKVEGGFTKANYLLRAMRLPAGQNQKLEMRFEPVSYYMGEKISLAASALTILLCLFALYLWYKGGAVFADQAGIGSTETEKSGDTAASKKKK